MGKSENGVLYANEIATFDKWRRNHLSNPSLDNFIDNMTAPAIYDSMIHSDRWSLCYDWLAESGYDTNLATGFAYWLEK